MTQTFNITFQGCNCIVGIGGGTGSNATRTPVNALAGAPSAGGCGDPFTDSGFVLGKYTNCVEAETNPNLICSAGSIQVASARDSAIRCGFRTQDGNTGFAAPDNIEVLATIGAPTGSPRLGLCLRAPGNMSTTSATMYAGIIDYTDSKLKLVHWVFKNLKSLGTVIDSTPISGGLAGTLYLRFEMGSLGTNVNLSTGFDPLCVVETGGCGGTIDSANVGGNVASLAHPEIVRPAGWIDGGIVAVGSATPSPDALVTMTNVYTFNDT